MSTKTPCDFIVDGNISDQQILRRHASGGLDAFLPRGEGDHQEMHAKFRLVHCNLKETVLNHGGKMLEGILVARALELRKERNIGKFDDCKSFQDYRRRLGDLPFDNNSRAMVAVLMVDVWTNQIQKLEHTIMTTMGLEYKQELVDPKKTAAQR